jgi:hypothetical protein
MRNLKKYLMSFVMIMPMIILLAHDIIPHHHHGDHGQGMHAHHHEAHSHEPHSHSHHNDHHHHHANAEIEVSDIHGIFFEHKHGKEDAHTCFLTHHRVQKEIKYVVFLESDEIDYGYRETIDKKKHYVIDYRLLPEPIKLLHSLRAPPALA